MLIARRVVLWKEGGSTWPRVSFGAEKRTCIFMTVENVHFLIVNRALFALRVKFPS